MSRTAVIAAEKRGDVLPLPDGGYDIAQCAANVEGNKRKLGRPRSVTGEKQTRKQAQDRGAERVAVPRDATAVVVGTLAAHGVPVEGEPSLRDAQTAHEILKARRAQLDVDRLRGKLV